MNWSNEKVLNDFIELPKIDFLRKYPEVSETEYEESWVENIKDLCEFIKETDDFYDLDKVEFILVNKENEKDVYAFISDKNEECAYLANVFDVNRSYGTPEWDFSFNAYLFEFLEEGYEIKWMDEDVHAAIWLEVDAWYPDEYKSTKGVQDYLKYCKKNGITKESIKKTYKNYVPDIMKFLEKEKERER